VTNKQFDLFGCEIVTPVRKPVNVASVPQRSPFRYPGGKTWFVPRLRQWLSYQLKKPRLLIEPFAGGGIVSLTAGFEDLAESMENNTLKRC
jgi:DNA adenine methylase